VRGRRIFTLKKEVSMALTYSVLAGKPEKFDGQDTENIKFSDSAKSLDGALKIIHDQKLYSFPICRIEIAGFEAERGLNKRWIRKMAESLYLCLPFIYLLALFAASNFHDYRLNQLYKHLKPENDIVEQSISHPQYQRAEEGKVGTIHWAVEHHPDEFWRLKPLIAKSNNKADLKHQQHVPSPRGTCINSCMHDIFLTLRRKELNTLLRDLSKANQI
jgi:hypothetical protein